jgi:hypothetical protein
MHVSSKVWDISSFYEYCLNNNYTKSKRTLERELLELSFYPKILFDKKDSYLIKTAFAAWNKTCTSKRYLSLNSSILYFIKNILFFMKIVGVKNTGMEYLTLQIKL